MTHDPAAAAKNTSTAAARMNNFQIVKQSFTIAYLIIFIKDVINNVRV